MAGPLKISRGDDSPIRFKLQKRDDAGLWGTPDFVGASVRSFFVDADRSWTVELPSVFEDEDEGIVAATPSAGSFPGSGITPGYVQARVTYSGGGTESFPKGADRSAFVLDDDFQP